MVTMEALHALTAELHAGFLTLAFISIMGVAVAQIVIRLREWMPEFLVRWSVKVRGYLEAAGYVGAVLGIIGLLLSAWTGMYAWPQDILLDHPTIRSKITLTAFATVMWAGIVFIRARFGRGLWTCPAMATLYVALTFVAFGILGTTGSMGAHLVQGGSALDPLWNFVGFDVSSDLILSTDLSFLLVITSVVLFVVSLYLAKRMDLFAVQLGPETCQKVFKWDEPRIEAEAPRNE